MLSYKDIARLFEEIELRLIASLKRNLTRHKKEERQEGFSWSMWQAEKLRHLESFRRQNKAVMAEYSSLIDSQTGKLMQEQFDEGEQLAAQYEEAGVEQPSFFGINEQRMNSLMSDITSIEKRAETAALRMTDDIYRQTVNRAQLAMAAGEMTLDKAVDMAVEDFLNSGINCIVYKDGRRVNIADYVRMALRTTATRANLQGQAKRYAELGVDTAQISSYSMCSETCEPWQGRAYIDDVFTPWQGETEQRGGEVWGKSNYCGRWFPLLSTAVSKGLFHPNCRHTMLYYKEGVSELAPPIPAEELKRLREREQKQRALERNVRKAKRRVAGFSDPDNIKQAKAELKAAQKELREYIAKVGADEGRTVLKRNGAREKVYEGEGVNNSPIDKSGESGIIREGSNQKPITEITDSAIERVPNVKISGYTDEQCAEIQKQHKELLEYSRKNNKNKEVAFVFDSSLNNRKEYTGSDDIIDFGNDLSGKDLVLLHNHPRNSSYSFNDIVEFFGNDSIKTLTIVKNNGNVETLTKIGSYDIFETLKKLNRIDNDIIKTAPDKGEFRDSLYIKETKNFLKKHQLGGLIEWKK